MLRKHRSGTLIRRFVGDMLESKRFARIISQFRNSSFVRRASALSLACLLC